VDGLKKEGDKMLFALSELVEVMAHCLRQADVPGHLRAWWYVVTHKEVALGDG